MLTCSLAASTTVALRAPGASAARLRSSSTASSAARRSVGLRPHCPPPAALRASVFPPASKRRGPLRIAAASHPNGCVKGGLFPFRGAGPFKRREEKNLTTDEAAAPEDEEMHWWRKLADKSKGPALALAVAAVILSAPMDAWAARSGGRMGGGSFRASSSSRSFSSSPSMGRSSMGGRSSIGGYRGSSLVAPSVFVAPTYGYGYGMGMPMFFGPGLFNLMFAAFALVFVAQAFMNLFGGGGGLEFGADRIGVVKVQIGLLGMARTLQEDLERIAEKADTSDPEGLHYVLEETVLALLRNPEYSVYGYATSKSAIGPEEAEEVFNEFSMEERGKIGEETLVNVNDRIKRAKAKGEDVGEDGVRNEYILVTIIAAADGNVKLPPVTDAQELRTALKRLGAIRVDALQAVEVIWTPQEEGDTLSIEELLQDFPYLNNL